MFRNPITFVLFFLWFTTALAEGNRAPFDLPEAESELVAGYSTEYSGMRYLFFFFAEWANVFVMCGIARALFLGGWQIPGVTAAQQEAHFGLQLVGAVLFLLKSWVLDLRRHLDPLDAAARPHRSDDEPLLEVVRPASFVAFILDRRLGRVEPAAGGAVRSSASGCSRCGWPWSSISSCRVRYNLRAANVQII